MESVLSLKFVFYRFVNKSLPGYGGHANKFFSNYSILR